MDFVKRVAPELREVLSLMPDLKLPDDLEMVRNFPIPQIEKSQHVITTSRLIAGPDQELFIKIYEPAHRSETPLPAVLWIHGGGYMMGHPDMNDGLCEIFVKEANCVVVAVAYRLAPEHPYPAAIEDCYACLSWMTAASTQLNIDLERVAVAGASAGGGLAAALTLMTRDRNGPAIAFQMPLYPMIDDRNVTPSSLEITSSDAPWNRSRNITGWSLYLGEHASEEISPYAAPARATNLAGLPPAYTCVGQLDPFRDETIEYVTRLAQAGVPVEFHIFPGCYHGFEDIVPQAKVSLRARQEYVQALSRALNPEFIAEESIGKEV
ncbi:alpha/beta hydrolase [Paenibacillus sp. LHD-117]|uniref:alpha/beta hydrolase n=1 Tax=Paenibacillus sp. LHD-117 TaxID=3071412 RepID=UPI0027E03A7F|nr:alpha/beta hydrolase [Paenibacillus sp. LHD-117]MDQ6418438.1 alpha/beta hydrolase [Paenibacillus sp. LHD-117]